MNDSKMPIHPMTSPNLALRRVVVFCQSGWSLWLRMNFLPHRIAITPKAKVNTVRTIPQMGYQKYQHRTRDASPKMNEREDCFFAVIRI